MLSSLVQKEKDPISLEKNRLERSRASLQRELNLLEMQLNTSDRHHIAVEKLPIDAETLHMASETTPIATKKEGARFVIREEVPRAQPSYKQLKIQQRRARNRFMGLCFMVVVLLILVTKTIF